MTRRPFPRSRLRLGVVLAAVLIVVACAPTTLRGSPTRRVRPAPLPIATPYIAAVTPICVLPDGRGRYEARARYGGTYSYVIVVLPGVELVAEGNPPVPAGVTLRVETATVPFYLVWDQAGTWVRASPSVTTRPLARC